VLVFSGSLVKEKQLWIEVVDIIESWQVLALTRRDIEAEMFENFRIARFGHKFYVQMLFEGQWITMAGLHRGAVGPYAERFCVAKNPFYHIEQTIPEIIKAIKIEGIKPVPVSQPELQNFEVISTRDVRNRLDDYIDQGKYSSNEPYPSWVV